MLNKHKLKARASAGAVEIRWPKQRYDIISPERLTEMIHQLTMVGDRARRQRYDLENPPKEQG